MLIVCPSCASEYALDPERIGDRGRKVRCASCRTTWMVRRAETSETGGDRGGDGSGEPERPTIEAVPHSARRQADPASRRPAQRTRGRSGRVPEMLAAVAILLALLGLPAGLMLRDQLARHLPATGSLFALTGHRVNLVGLDLADVSAAIGDENGARVLVVEGEIRSASTQAVTVPRLEFSIESKQQDHLYRWSVKAPVAELGSGESARFVARLASPPPTGERLVATFQTSSGDRAVALR